MSFARALAFTKTAEAEVADVTSDPHSPSRFRVDGVLSNVPEFAQAFGCSKTAKVRVLLLPLRVLFGMNSDACMLFR